MTTTAVPDLRPRVAGPVTFPRVVRAEWTKLVSLRSTWWTTAAAALLVLGIGLLVAFDRASDPGFGDPESGFDFARASLIGTIFAQLALGILAALTVTGEYGTGMIRSSLTVVPRRWPVLAAKAVVVGAFVFVVTVLVGLAAVALNVVIARAEGVAVPSLLTGDVARVVLGMPLTMVVTAGIALAVGVLLRATAGAIAVLVALYFVVPLVWVALPSAVQGVTPYLPANAGASLTGLSFVQGSAAPLAPWPGFAVMAAWAAVLLAVAFVRLRRSDV